MSKSKRKEKNIVHQIEPVKREPYKERSLVRKEEEGVSIDYNLLQKAMDDISVYNLFLTSKKDEATFYIEGHVSFKFSSETNLYADGKYMKVTFPRKERISFSLLLKPMAEAPFFQLNDSNDLSFFVKQRAGIEGEFRQLFSDLFNKESIRKTYIESKSIVQIKQIIAELERDIAVNEAERVKAEKAVNETREAVCEMGKQLVSVLNEQTKQRLRQQIAENLKKNLNNFSNGKYEDNTLKLKRMLLENKAEAFLELNKNKVGTSFIAFKEKEILVNQKNYQLIINRLFALEALHQDISDKLGRLPENKRALQEQQEELEQETEKANKLLEKQLNEKCVFEKEFVARIIQQLREEKGVEVAVDNVPTSTDIGVVFLKEQKKHHLK